MRVEILKKRIREKNINSEKPAAKYFRLTMALAAFNNNTDNINIKLYLTVFFSAIICNENEPKFNLNRMFNYILILIIYNKAVNNPKRKKQ